MVVSGKPGEVTIILGAVDGVMTSGAFGPLTLPP